MLVCVLDGPGHFLDQLGGEPRLDALGKLELRQILPVDELHRQIVESVLLADLVDDVKLPIGRCLLIDGTEAGSRILILCHDLASRVLYFVIRGAAPRHLRVLSPTGRKGRT